MDERSGDPQLAERIRKAREQAGMTQAGLATTTGFSQRKVSNIETATRNVSPQDLLALAKALGTTVGDLLGEEPSDADMARIPGWSELSPDAQEWVRQTVGMLNRTAEAPRPAATPRRRRTG